MKILSSLCSLAAGEFRVRDDEGDPDRAEWVPDRWLDSSNSRSLSFENVW